MKTEYLCCYVVHTHTGHVHGDRVITADEFRHLEATRRVIASHESTAHCVQRISFVSVTQIPQPE